MKRLLLTCLISTAICLPALAALKDGEKAPDFTAQASLAGKEFKFSLKDSLKKGPVVVYSILRPIPRAATCRRTRSR